MRNCQVCPANSVNYLSRAIIRAINIINIHNRGGRLRFTRKYESKSVQTRKRISCPRDTLQSNSKQRTAAVQLESGIYSHPSGGEMPAERSLKSSCVYIHRALAPRRVSITPSAFAKAL